MNNNTETIEQDKKVLNAFELENEQLRKMHNIAVDKYKELLDSHNELLELLRNSRPLMQPREYCKGDDYLILDGRIENAINKAKNIKL